MSSVGTTTTAARKTQEVTTPYFELLESEDAAFQRLRESRFRRMEKEHDLLRSARPHELIHELYDETSSTLKLAAPGLEIQAERIREQFKARFRGLSPEVLGLDAIDVDGFYDRDVLRPRPRPVAGVGEFWWARTAYFWSLGLSVDVPDWIRIWGHVHYKGDPLLVGTVGAIEEFVLSPNRFPTVASTTFEVRTELRLRGILSGFTGLYHPIFAADDKWCKCWRFTRQTVFASNGQPFDHRELQVPMIDLQNAHPAGQANPVLTGAVLNTLHVDAALPALAQSGTSILLQIETRFDIQLEGDAEIWFRHAGGTAAESVPSIENAVMFQSMPMSLTPR